jgi:VWFA-related protein
MSALPAFLLCLTVLSSHDQIQKPPGEQKTDQAGTPIHVNVGLVQTDVMVFDRHGHFVPDLKKDQFELRVDGKVQPISFFELVSAGSPHDEEVWAKEEGKPPSQPPSPAASSPNPGRTLLFFLDDWHMSDDSVMRSRAALENLVNTSVGPKDRVAIFSASGQLGSAQQLTSDKAVLLALLKKFNFQSPGVQDLQWPPMTEAQAFLIEQNDRDVLLYFVSAILGRPADLDRMSRDVGEAVDVTKKRAAALAQTSAAIGERTLLALRNLLRSAEALPGRKLVFYLSDGFVLQPQRSDTVSKITDLTTTAARAGIVIYTLDARGLLVGLPDARVKRGADMTGALAHSGVNEVSASMDALNALASDTGGRFLKNTNALGPALMNTLTEISRYYLLAWPIDQDELQRDKYSTIRVSIKGRSDLTVRVRQGSLNLSQLVAQRKNEIESAGAQKPASVIPSQAMPSSEIEIYAKARTVVDLTREELLKAYSAELRDLEFEENQQELNSLLAKVGERVAAFFHDLPNIVSREQVRRERLGSDGRVTDSVTQSFNYSVSIDRIGNPEESRTGSGGRTIPPERMLVYSFLTSGFASMPIHFHPDHQFGSRFRYLGRELAAPRAYVIAFAQKPGIADVVGRFTTPDPPVQAHLLYQGFAWLDPKTYQIVRMRTDLLAPRGDALLDKVTSETWFGEVRFKSIPEAFWLPQEVIVTLETSGQLFRNRHRYSDYAALTVAVQEKIAPPVIKK